MKALPTRMEQRFENAGAGEIAKWTGLLLAAIGYLDFATGLEVSVSFFYLVPVALAAWFGPRSLSYLVASLSALVGQFSNDLAGDHHSHWAITLWNDLFQFFFFLVVAQLLIQVRSSFQRAKTASQQDFLTGLPNRPTLLTRLEGELARASRTGQPIAVGYLDLDHFKQVNDRYGHSEGDRLLYLVGRAVRDELRRSDILARVGGDEFVVVLPECSGDSAAVVARKILDVISALSKANGWPVSASLGVVQIDRPKAFEEVGALIEHADALMYEAKANGRNDFRLEVRKA
jgi:diguanylate cyclase (GGDEF)-like protein